MGIKIQVFSKQGCHDFNETFLKYTKKPNKIYRSFSQKYDPEVIGQKMLYTPSYKVENLKIQF